MQYAEAVSYLSRYTNYERELRYPYDGWAMNLERVRALLHELGDPDRGLPVAHLAGTKGKGSTAALLESVVRAAGYSTVLYTSPHLLDFRERIRVSGEMVSEAAVGQGVSRLIPAARKVEARPELGPLTYFEVLTALAFAVFAEAQVDLAVLETGLGGRYDATNVCDPLLAVLTPISLDHTDILGDTLAAIASEKAMIVKPGRPAVIAPQPEEASSVFRARCNEVGAPMVLVEEKYQWRILKEAVSGQWLSFSGSRDLPELFLPLVGEHQALNAAAALTAVDLLVERGFRIGDDAVKQGLATVRWPARFERVRERPDLVLDGAHNAASAAYLCATVQRLYSGKKVIAVIGLGKDKDVEGFCRELGPCLSAAILTSSRAMKAASADRLRAALLEFSLNIFETADVAGAMALAQKEARPEDLILVTGSFYVVAEALAWNQQNK